MLRAGHQRADSVLTRACRACILINPFPRGGSQVWAGVARGSKVTPLGSSKADVQTFRTKEPRCRLGQPVLVTHLGIQVPLRAPIKNAEVGFPGGSVVKNLPTKPETRVRSLGREDPLEKEMATHSSILAWEIPCTEEPGGLTVPGVAKNQT